MNPPPDRYDLSWHRPELTWILLLCAVGAVALAVRLGSPRRWFATAPPVLAGRVQAAGERIDPNTATVASLRRLPGLGRLRAEAIVRHREKAGVPFRRPEDLEAVPGLGPALVQRLAPYLSLAPPDS